MLNLSFVFILLDWAILLTVEAYSCKGHFDKRVNVMLFCLIVIYFGWLHLHVEMASNYICYMNIHFEYGYNPPQTSHH